MSIFNSDENKIKYEVSVSSVKKLEKGIGFTLNVNGVSIYQMDNFLNGDLDEMIDNLTAADTANKLSGGEVD